MRFESEKFIEVLKLRTSLYKWKIFAVVLAVMLVITFITHKTSKSPVNVSRPIIARVHINGMIKLDEVRERILKENIVNNNNVKAMILVINSPGGSVGGSEQLYNSIRSIAKIKPVYAVVKEMATSGAYMASIATHKIIVAPSSIVGSIGVILTSPNLSKAMEKFGVSQHRIASSEYKAQPSLYHDMSEQVQEYLQDLNYDLNDLFRKKIIESRSEFFDQESILNVANGKVYTGTQAMDLKLVDLLGNEETALDLLKTEHNIDCSVVDIPMSLNNKKDYKIDILAKALGFLASRISDDNSYEDVYHFSYIRADYL
ncbi:MAG: signal peptide peptidase SppA, 36K type [Candidatus Xenolissoclinum pacificiensis L6]|uniref:Signal peptide peptidase SppA, 36K type n=1 Tax=Candidatus Xenolissoclinum pacificiensis L6 TaxID=1401685 RepID=W2UZD8_9RICK|nr:MAG: signal peptide peptidase SppA, 36K type [Candidatus Xenolissoclinum pacificiensis L6]